MGNITDDIRADLEDFDTRPFGETDSLALSQLAYARMPDNVPRHREPTDDAGGRRARARRRRDGSPPRHAARGML